MRVSGADVLHDTVDGGALTMISAAQHDDGPRRNAPTRTVGTPPAAPVPAPRDGHDADAAGATGTPVVDRPGAPGERYAASPAARIVPDRGLDDTVVRVEAAASALVWVLLLALLGAVGLVLALLA